MRGDRIEISSLPRCAEGGPSTYDLSIPVRTKALGPPVIVDGRGVRVLLTVTIHPTGAWGDMRGTAGNIYVYIKKKSKTKNRKRTISYSHMGPTDIEDRRQVDLRRTPPSSFFSTREQVAFVQEKDNVDICQQLARCHGFSGHKRAGWESEHACGISTSLLTVVKVGLCSTLFYYT